VHYEANEVGLKYEMGEKGKKENMRARKCFIIPKYKAKKPCLPFCVM